MRVSRAFLPLLVLCLSSVGPLFAQDAEWYEGKLIQRVEFSGLSGIDKRDLEGVTRPFINKPFSSELFLDLQSRIYDTDYFEEISASILPVETDAAKVILLFDVKEKATIASVKFEGNAGVKAYDLQDAVTTKVGDVIDRVKIAGDEAAVKKVYLDKGYPEVAVSHEERKSSKGIDLVFIVTEGAQITVRRISFQGNASFSEKTLKDVLPLKETALFVPGQYEEEKFRASVDAIVTYYKDRGFIDARVEQPADKEIFNDEKKKKTFMDITFTVNEGKRYTYSDISFEGNKIFKEEKLRSLTTMKPKAGETFNYSRYTADFDRVRNLYFENGYVFNQIEPELVRDEQALSIGVKVKIVERDRAHINSIVIKGNEKTKDHVITRELPFQEGDIFSKAKVESGLRSLYNLQYFSEIFPDVIPVSEQLVDMVLSVKEQKTAGLNLGMTYIPNTGESNTIPIGFFIKWNDSNFLGNGQDFSIDLELNNTTQSLIFAFTEKYLFGYPWSGGVNFSISHSQKETPMDILGPVFIGQNVPDPYSSYEEYVASGYSVPDEYLMTYESFSVGLGGSTGYTFKWKPGDLTLKAGVNSNLSNAYYDDTQYRPYSADIRENHERWILSNSLTLAGNFDALDNYANPGKGYYLGEKFSVVGLVPSDLPGTALDNFEIQHYFLNEVKAEAFITLFKFPIVQGWNFKAVLGADSTLTSILPQFNQEKPQVKTGYYPHVDGMTKLRGWNSLASVDTTTIWSNWVELRMPIAEQYVWLDLFADAAVVVTPDGIMTPSSAGITSSSDASDLRNLSLSNLMLSTGFMFRITMPQLPLKVGLAKRFCFENGALTPLSGEIEMPWESGWSSGKGWQLVISLSQLLL